MFVLLLCCVFVKSETEQPLLKIALISNECNCVTIVEY